MTEGYFHHSVKCSHLHSAVFYVGDMEGFPSDQKVAADLCFISLEVITSQKERKEERNE